MSIERLSIELTNRCGKACWFCYNHSLPEGETRWEVEEVVSFVRDCAVYGVKAVSFGGGEPLQYPALFDVLRELDGVLFRSITTNGLLLHGELLEQLVAARPNKVHVSIHFPERVHEVDRVIEQVSDLQARGIRSGVNLLVARTHLKAATLAASRLREASISNDRIVYLPMRGQDTPTPDELAEVAGRIPFQSMTCLTQCGPSPRFASIGWDKTFAWCSYTTSRHTLSALSYDGLSRAMNGLGLEFCGGTEDVEPSGKRGLAIIA